MTYILAEKLKENSELLEITSDRIYYDNAKTKYDTDGLFSERIFGPKKAYSCECGKLSTKIFNGKTCPNCQVKCVNSDFRYKTFGKIRIPFPILNPLSKKYFNQMTTKKNRSILSPTQFDLTSSSKLFLEYDKSTDKLLIVNNYNPKCVPLLITGNFSFFIAIYTINKHYNSKNAEKFLNHFIFDLLVIPPGSRQPFVKNNLNKKNIINSELDDIYIPILRQKKYKQAEMLDFENKIEEYVKMSISSIENENHIPIEDSELLFYDKSASTIQFYVDKLFEECLTKISGKNGLVRFSFLGKHIDFSARAIVVADPSLQAYEIKVPIIMFFKLYILEYYHFLRQNYGDDWNCININRLLKPVKNSEFDTTSSEIIKNEKFLEFVTHIFENMDEKYRLVYMNRQPTLWKYGIPAVKIVGITDTDVISVSNLIVEPLNMDFDGDSAAIYKLHDIDSINETYSNSYLRDLIVYEHNGHKLHTILNEADYTFNILKLSIPNDKIYEIIQLDDLKKYENYLDLSIKLNQRFNFKNNIYSYGHILLNAWCGFDNIILNENSITEDISNLIYEFSKNNEDYYYKLGELNRKLNWFLTTYQSETFTVPFDDACKLLSSASNNKLIKNLPKNPMIGFPIYEAISNKFYNAIDKNSMLYKLTKSKFKKIQFSKSLLSIGFISDSENKVVSSPIKGNVLGGLTEDAFFASSFGTRKAIVDKIEAVPESGYAQRTLVVNLSPLEIVDYDCKTTNTFDITIQSKKHLGTLVNRFIVNDNKVEKINIENLNLIGTTIKLRSPITCFSDNFKLCKICCGDYDFKSNYIGILAGQYLEERLTQSIMSSHHLSGAAKIEFDDSLVDFIQENLIDIEKKDDYFDLIFKSNLPTSIIKLVSEDKLYKFKSNSEKTVSFYNYTSFERLPNQDAGQIVFNVNNLLKSFISTKNNKMPPLEQTYYNLVNEFFKISNNYTLFIEILLANSHVNKNNIIYRYCLKNNLDSTIFRRYSIKSLNNIFTNKILGWLYEPNKTSIKNFNDFINETDVEKLSVFEKIWLNKF